MRDATWLITGGTGSFGRRFVRYVLDHLEPRWIRILSRCEYKQAEMAATYKDARLQFCLGDVRDLARVEQAMRDVEYVIHTAALKRIEAAELNTEEVTQVNVIGTANVMNAAMSMPTVTRAVLLSTDKAVEPITFYGGTKFVAEKLWIQANRKRQIFSVVRYGNVMASRGGVLEHYHELLRQGAESLPVTDERMTRFWMTFEDAIDLVIMALARCPGLRFIAKSPSFRITDLALSLCPKYHVSGWHVDEKLAEVLVHRYEAPRAYDAGDTILITPEIPGIVNGIAHKRWAGEYRSDTNPDFLTQEQIRERVHEVAS